MHSHNRQVWDTDTQGHVVWSGQRSKPSRLREIWSEPVLSDFQNLKIRHPYKHAQSSLPGEKGLGPHTLSTCAGTCRCYYHYYYHDVLAESNEHAGLPEWGPHPCLSTTCLGESPLHHQQVLSMLLVEIGVGGSQASNASCLCHEKRTVSILSHAAITV